MERIPPNAHTELISDVLSGFTGRMRELLRGVHFVIDRDPAWIGLHSQQKTGDGRLFANTSHVVPRCSQDNFADYNRETTVVLLDGDERRRIMILHELGHVLDERLNWDHPPVFALDDYAATNCWEAFATAFQSWAVPFGKDHKHFHTRQQLLAVDPAASAFFDSLSRPV